MDFRLLIVLRSEAMPTGPVIDFIHLILLAMMSPRSSDSGPERRLVQRSEMSDVGGQAEVACARSKDASDGRVLQARCDEWRRLVLRFCIRPLNGAVLLLAIMDIRAHPISFSERP